MSRLQKKCFVAATGLHGLLLLVLVVSPALTKAPEQPAPGGLPPVMELIPAPKGIAGNPALTISVPAPPQPKKEEEVTPPPPPPPPPPQVVEPPKKKEEPVKEPEHTSPIVVKQPVKDADIPAVTRKTEIKPPKKVEIKPTKKDPPKKETAKTKESEPPKLEAKKPDAPKIKIADTDHLVKRNSDEAAKKAAAATESRAATARAAGAAHAAQLAKLNGSIGGLKNNLSESVNIEAVGANASAFASYGQRVVAIYELNWVNKPEDVTEDNVIVHVSVTILRDGSVKNAHIVRASGKGSVDRSVKQTLEKVRELPPFPAGATDAERTFNIDFNLKTSKRIG